MGKPMSSFAAAIMLVALALLARGTSAQKAVDNRAGISAPLQPGIGVHDPRIRVDPDAVPGVLFMSHPAARDRANIIDMAPTILQYLGAPVPKAMEGISLL